MVKKVLSWGALAFILFFIAFRPDTDLFVSLGGGIKEVAQSLGDFFTTLVG